MNIIVNLSDAKWQSVKDGTWCGSKEIADGIPLEPCEYAISHDCDNCEKVTKAYFDGQYYADSLEAEAHGNEQRAVVPCGDAISRQAVLDLLEDTNNGWILNEVSQLPTVTSQEPKTGHWIESDAADPCWWVCSICHRQVDIKENYCPNCGAQMESEDNG